MNNAIKTLGRILKQCCRVRYLIGGGVVIFCIILPFLLDRSEDRYSRIRTFPMMGTVGRITIWSDREDLPEAAMNEAQKVIGEIEKVCNIFNRESELSRLNRTAYEKEFGCSPLLWEMLCAADHYWKFSGGAYDPTVKPLMRLWGFRGKRKTLPTGAEIAGMLKKVGWDKVKLDPEKHSVRFLAAGVGIDFGGIAKGFALDQAKAVLRKHGITRAVLDFGGNIGCIIPEKHEPFRIGIRNPEAADQLADAVTMRNQCAATSGNYERYVVIDGKQYTHIMDPRTGLPVSGMLSVTVVTPRGADSDALSTAIFVKGEKFAAEVCVKLPDTGVYIIRRPPGKETGMEIRRFGLFAR